MNEALDILVLERKRREKGAKLAAQLRAQEATATENLDIELGRVLSVRRAEMEKYEDRWRQWFAGHGERNCRHHHARILDVDEAESFRRSYESPEMLAVFKPCTDCVAAAKQARSAVRLAKMGFPENLFHARLTNWNPGDEVQAKNLERVKAWSARPAGGLVIIGPGFGNGKSHLAAGALAAQESGGIFAIWDALMVQVRGTYGGAGDTEGLLQKLARTPLLVLDEIGFGTGGKDEMPILHFLLNSRIAESRPFIVTGNFGRKEDLRPVLGDRLFDRFTGSIYATVVVTGPSRRPENRNRYLELALEKAAS